MSRRAWSWPIVVAVVPVAVACGTNEPSTVSDPAGARSSTSPGVSAEVPGACVAAGEATRTSVEGEPNWARFCPGPDGMTAFAEVPSDALTAYLDRLGGLREVDGVAGQDDSCRADFGPTYRLQVGYADGDVAQISGSTAPACLGTILGDDSSVAGPAELGVYGVVMSAFGQQYADQYDPADAGPPLTCPADPRKPDSVDRDGASAALETGYHLGRPEPMVMPLTAERGILCTWLDDEDEPRVSQLSADEAERVRIGMHAIYPAMVGCALSPDPTYTAVVEDKTGTRRAVTIIESECSTVVRSDGGYGLGFPWLDT